MLGGQRVGLIGLLRGKRWLRKGRDGRARLLIWFDVLLMNVFTDNSVMYYQCIPSAMYV